MEERYVDLHLHTTGSDGDRSLEETICDAKEAGLSAIAITDHNVFTLERPMLSGNLEVIPGAEFGTTYRYGESEKKEVHIVGLFFGGIDLSLKSIFDGIDKHENVRAIIKKLNSLGIAITMEEVEEEASSHVSYQFGRHQVADVLVKKGYSPNRSAAMDQWVGNYSPYYINTLDYIHYIEMEECVRKISGSKGPGGIQGFPILAHPLYYKFTPKGVEEMVCRYREVTDGPLGMEVYYGKYNEKEVEFLEMLADKYHLYPSAASDRHRKEQSFVRGGYSLLADMKKAVMG